MVIAIGLSSYNLALFHLVNHAFYKGLLFLGAGAVIHAVGDNQDFRRYGGLIRYLPLTYSIMLIASLSLVAFPFMTGFYSKDFILESAFGQYYFSSLAAYVIAVIGAIFTTLYSVKVLYLTFLTSPNGPNKFYQIKEFYKESKAPKISKLPWYGIRPFLPIIQNKGLVVKNGVLFEKWILTRNLVAHEGDIFLTLPLVVLAIFSIFFGYVTKDIFIGLGSSFFIDNSIFIHPLHEIMLDTEFAVPVLFKLLPLVFTISFSIFAIIYSEFLPESLINFKFTKLGYNIFGFFNQRFLVEMFYNKYITNLVLNLGGQTTKILDKGSIELIGPWGLELGLVKLSKNIGSLSTGVVTSYALYILIGLITYLLFNAFLNQIEWELVLLGVLTGFSFMAIYSSFIPYSYKNTRNYSIPVNSSFGIKGFLNNKVLQSNFLNYFFFYYFKLKDFYIYNRQYFLLAYLFLIILNLLNQYINPEFSNLYVVEDDKTSSSNNVDSSSNTETSNVKYEYKGVAENIHDEIAEIDKKLSKLELSSENYLKEKEALLDERESLTDHMTLLNQYKSTRLNDSYIPQSSDNKREADTSPAVASSSKRSRD